jgi:hypothetical protein
LFQVFTPEDRLPATKTFQVTGVPDGVRDGPKKWELRLDPSSYNASLFGNFTLRSLSFVNNDTKPIITTISPQAVPQIGGNITVTGFEWDWGVKVMVGNITVNDSSIQKLFEPRARALRSSLQTPTDVFQTLGMLITI